MIEREKFFEQIKKPLFKGAFTQSQVDGMNSLLDVWEHHFEAEDIRWLAYALATAFHETGAKMVPVEEIGRGSGKTYGKPVGPHEKTYFGRGHVQLTWEDNYKKGEENLKNRYNVIAPLHKYPHLMLSDEMSALVLFDGMIHGWFSGVGLEDYFNEKEEDPYNARKIVNALDKAELIKGYYGTFKTALA